MNKAPDPEVMDVVGLYTMCQSFHVLPREGGLFDQDQLLMRQFDIVGQAIEERTKREREAAKKQKSSGRRG